MNGKATTDNRDRRIHLRRILGGMSMSDKLMKHNRALIQYMMGFNTQKNITYVLRDALNDPEYSSWSVADVRLLAGYLDSQWGIGLVEHCDKVIEEWRQKYGEEE